MRSSATKSFYLFSALTMALLWSGTARAQSAAEEKAPLYTYVSEWTVPRAMWADYQKMEASGNEAMNKLVADGTIVSYGNFSEIVHQDGLPTHGTWFSAHSIAALLKVLEGIRSGPDATGPILGASKHWDYLLESRDYNAHSGTFKNGYLRVGAWKFKAGANDPDGKIMKSTMVAMLEKLLADGALHSYQIDEELVHTSDPGGFYVALVANGAEGLDKFSAALDENRKKNPAGMAGFSSLLDSQGHRDSLSHVDTMTHK